MALVSCEFPVAYIRAHDVASSTAFFAMKRHNQALITLARRRCDVLFAMLRDGTIYQPKAAPNADEGHRGTPGAETTCFRCVDRLK